MIKYIAIITMTLNHISNIFLDPDTLLGEALLDIGYFTAVTMCYFLVEGYHYTHSKKKYGQRLLVFALISQIPFQEAVGAAAFNMLFTLFFCFLILCAKEYIRRPAERTVAIICLTACTLFGDWALLAAVFTLLLTGAEEIRKRRPGPMGSLLWSLEASTSFPTTWPEMPWARRCFGHWLPGEGSSSPV